MYKRQIDDSIRAGILREADLPQQYTDVLGHSHSDRITTLVTDLVCHARSMMEQADSREQLQLCFTPDIDQALRGLRAFLFDNVYPVSYTHLIKEAGTNDALSFQAVPVTLQAII